MPVTAGPTATSNGETRVYVLFQANDEPAGNARVDVYDTQLPDKLHYSGATNAMGIRVIEKDVLDQQTEYYFVAKRAGYIRKYKKDKPSSNIRILLTPRYAP